MDIHEEIIKNSFDEGWKVFPCGDGYEVLVWDDMDQYLAFVDVRLLHMNNGRPRDRVMNSGRMMKEDDRSLA